MNKKPSEIILAKHIFTLSNTVGSSQLEYMLDNKNYYIEANIATLFMDLLDYLDELHEAGLLTNNKE